MLDVLQSCSAVGETKTSDDNPSNEKILGKNDAVSSKVGYNLNKTCLNRCKQDFSKKVAGMEVNNDLILECANLCRDVKNDSSYLAAARRPQSETFTIYIDGERTFNINNYVYETAKEKNFGDKKQIKAEAQYLKIPLKRDEVTTIKLDTMENNVIYACGHKIIKLDPTFPNMFKMAPDVVVGGDAEKNIIQMQANTQKTKTRQLLENGDYASILDFNYKKYLESFRYDTQKSYSLSKMREMLFCDIYKTMVADAEIKGQKKPSCSTLATENYLNASLCSKSTCNLPQDQSEDFYRRRVQAGQITKQKCEFEVATKILQRTNIKTDDGGNINTSGWNQADKATLRAYCDLDLFSLPKMDVIKMKQVQQEEISFYRSALSVSDDKTVWQEKRHHPCLNGWDSISNQKVLEKISKHDPNNNKINIDNYPEKIGCYPEWNIYNDSKHIDTGIKLSDGDSLSITWGGNLVLGNGLTIPFFDQSVAKALAIQKDFPIFSNFPRNTLQSVIAANPLKMMSTLEFDGLDPLVGESGKLPTRMDGDGPTTIKFNDGTEIKITPGEICAGKTIYDLRADGENERRWYNLEGRINRGGSSSTDKNKNSCEKMNIAGDSYSFSGNLGNIGQNIPLKIRHYKPRNDSERNLYANSVVTGGHQVLIEWGGCPMRDGEGLEIALGKDSADNWIPLSGSVIEKLIKGSGYSFFPKDSGITGDMEFNPSEHTAIFIRVNTDKYNNYTEDENFDNRIPDGGYTIKVTTAKHDQSLLDHFDLTKDIAQNIFFTLIGDPNADRFDGLLITLSNNIRKNIETIVIVLLVFYMTMLGLGFLMGTIKMNQKEFVDRALKVAVVCMLLNPEAWDWFCQQYGLLIKGSLQIAYDTQKIIYRLLGKDIIPSNGDNFFNLFSMHKLFLILFRSGFLDRLFALAFSSVIGLFIVMIIAWGFYLAIRMVLGAIFIYISAIVTQGCLLLISPVFILTKLFEVTKNMFDNWAKQVISFTIIPMAVTLSVTFFFLLLVTALDSTMNFTYCNKCFITIFGFCLVKAPYILGLNFFPSDPSSSFLLPIGVVSGALCFLIIVYVAEGATSLVVGIITRIITFRTETLGSSSMTGLGASLEKSGDAAFERATGGKNLKEAFAKHLQSKHLKSQLEQQKSLKDVGQAIHEVDSKPRGD